MKSRLLLLTWVCVLLLIVGVGGDSRGTFARALQCNPACDPPGGATVYDIRYIVVVVSGSITPQGWDMTLNRAATAANGWKGEYWDRGANLTLDYMASGSYNYRIELTDEIVEGQANVQGNTMTLPLEWFNGSFDQTYLRNVIAHEMGHWLGYGQSPCAGYSIMSDTWDTNNRWFTGCDETFLSGEIGETDNDGDGYTIGDDCNDNDPNVNPGVGDPPPCGHTGDWNCNGFADETECVTPVVVDVIGNGIDLTDSSAGVQFDFDGDGALERTSWTAVGSDDAWLVFDRNGNGRIDNGAELFGNRTPQPLSTEPNGFSALAVFDGPTAGGNGNGSFDVGDRYFDQLRLWRDSNHDGVSQPDELLTLQAVGILRISLEYVESRRKDRWGNWFRYRARVFDGTSRDVGKFAYDVFLLTGPAESARGPGRK